MRNILPSLRKSRIFQNLILASLLPGLLVFPVAVQANPAGANVVRGHVNIQGLGTANVNIITGTQQSIINWQSFSIAAGESTHFQQPNAAAVALNRVVTGNPSAIYGSLTSNGGVVLINPNGIVVGSGGVVDVAGMLTLSTLDATNEDFLNGGGMRFRGTSAAGIRNYGAITSSGGDVTLLGNFLQNSGSVSAPTGTVAFGAGGDIIVNQTASGGKISVLSGGPGGENGIENDGTISGAAAELKAHGNVYALAIKNDGLVRASGYNFKGGRLTLSGGARSRVVNTGQLVARNSDGSGGTIAVSGEDVSVAGSVDASGAAGQVGGSVAIAGDKVDIADGASINVGGSSAGSVSIDSGLAATVEGNIAAVGSTGSGGSVDVSADVVTVGSSASIDASGVTGGEVRVGGGFQGGDADIRNSQYTTVENGSVILADGTGGDAGRVILWSDGDTMFDGEVSAQATGNVGNGGFVEVSGLRSLRYFGRVSTAAVNGNTGRLLLDPTDVVIGPNAGATMSDAAVVAAVLANNVVIHTNSAGTGVGNISVQSGANIVYDSPNSLAFFAHGDIRVNGDIKNHGTTDSPTVDYNGAFNGTGNITLVAGWDGTGAAAFNFDPDNTGGATDGPRITAADVLGGTYGAYGVNDGSVFLNDQGLEPVEVGSARGETNAFGHRIELRAGLGNERFTQLGYRRENDLRGTAQTSTGTINTATDVNFFDGVTGNINVHANQDVLLVPSSAISTSGEGIKTNDRAYVMIGHGGIRENDNGLESRAGTDYGSDSGHISVGNGFNTGNITVNAARALVMTTNRAEAFTQIGHGGLGGDDPDGNTGNAASHTFNPYTFFPGLTDVNELGLTGVGAKFVLEQSSVGAGTSTETEQSIWGNMSGNISITAGIVDMEAGIYNKAPTRIGHGGMRVRGVHSGDIAVTTTTGGILMEAAPDSASGGPSNTNDWRWYNNRDQSSAQIGHGGFDSDFFNSFILPRRDGVGLPTGSGGAIVTVNDTSISGDGIRINPFSATGDAYGHSGNITVTSAAGIEVRAGDGTDAYAMFGHGGRSTQGDHKGDITVVAQNGSIIFDRDAWQVNERGHDITDLGQRAHAQIGHGGGRYQGGSTGNISVSATQDIEFYAGRSESYAMVGHGGRGEDNSTWNNGRQRNSQANGTHSGSITVNAGGDIKFRSGFSNRGTSFSQVGHGGYLQQADVFDASLVGGGASAADQEGHNGAISVTAGGDISFIAGATDLRDGQTWQEANAYDAWSMIGHGGYLSKGDHHGTVTVNATGDLNLEARGGWDAVGIRSTNTTGTPRLNSTDDNGRNGFRNFATIGHGGVDSTHNNNSGDNWNNSGKEGTGIGVASTSDIDVTVGGNLTMLGAMEATAGPALPILLYDDNGYDPPGNADASQRRVSTQANLTYISHEPLFVGSAELAAGGASGTVVIAVDRTTATSGQVFFNDAGSSDMVVLAGDGTSTIQQLIDAHNTAADGSGTLPIVELLAGDGTQVLATDARMVVTPYSTFSGTLAIEGGGTTAHAIVRANSLGNGGPVTLTGDGTSTLTQLVTAWNGANPTNQLTIEFDTGPAGAEVIATGASIVIDGGLEERPTPGQQFSRHYGRLDRVYRANGEVWSLPDPVYSAEDGYASIGNGGRSGDYRALIDGNGHRGNITLNVTGNITMQAGDIEPAVTTGQELPILVQNFQNDVTGDAALPEVGAGTVGGLGVYYVGPGIGGTSANFFENRGEQNDPTVAQRNYVHIGNGGWGARGDHAGNITITAGGDLDVIAGEGREDFAHIGHGGHDSDGYNADGSTNQNFLADNDGHSGSITITATGGRLRLLGGGRDTDVAGEPGTDPASMTAADVTRASYAQIGHGGSFTGQNHSGDVMVHMGTGIEMAAGASRQAYSQIGHGANSGRSETLTGDVTVITDAGDITMTAGRPVKDDNTVGEVSFDPMAVLGVAGNIAGNNNSGHISAAREASVRIGHGGFDNDAQGGNQNNGPNDGGFDGNITVTAVAGSVTVQGGGLLEFADMTAATANNDYFRGQDATIGHGGWATHGDLTGNVTVNAGTDINVFGGSAHREAWGQIGHGGYATDGNHNGVIDLNAGGNVVLRRGDGANNPWAKIGHGAQSFGGRNNNGTGTRDGDITISAGVNVQSTAGLIGHVDSVNDGDIFAAEGGNTYIAVSRNNPFAGGPGQLITDADTVITSGGFGVGNEVRFYMPDASANMIAETTQINNTEYTRVPAPGSGRNDELEATEHQFTTGAFGELIGDFTPEGDYPTNSFGLYNIYYSGPPPVAVNTNFNFASLLDQLFDTFDTYDRQREYILYDGYDGQFYSVGSDDAVEEDGNPAAGGFFLEEVLDNNLGNRRDNNSTEANDYAGEENDEERRRRRNNATRKVGASGLTFYIFAPGTNEYSSYRVFGVPEGGLPISQ